MVALSFTGDCVSVNQALEPESEAQIDLQYTVSLIAGFSGMRCLSSTMLKSPQQEKRHRTRVGLALEALLRILLYWRCSQEFERVTASTALV